MKQLSRLLLPVVIGIAVLLPAYYALAAGATGGVSSYSKGLELTERANEDCRDWDELDSKFLRTFAWHGRNYEVRFVEGPKAELAWREDLIMRWRIPGTAKWHNVSRITQVRLEKEIKLSDARGRTIDALVVSSPGGSAQFISIVEIRKNLPGLRILLNRALDKGTFDYRYDAAGRLIGLRFHYWAWHVSPGALPGHAYTAMNVGWLPAKHGFHEGPVYVDDEEERKASLVDFLTDVVDLDERFIQERHDEETGTYTYIYKPVGLLWQKTPKELRSAKRVKAVVKYGPEPDNKPYIAQIGAVETKAPAR